jgi:hypothetical protein
MSEAEYIAPKHEPDWANFDASETLNDVWEDHMRQVSNHRRL